MSMEEIQDQRIKDLQALWRVHVFLFSTLLLRLPSHT